LSVTTSGMSVTAVVPATLEAWLFRPDIYTVDGLAAGLPRCPGKLLCIHVHIAVCWVTTLWATAEQLAAQLAGRTSRSIGMHTRLGGRMARGLDARRFHRTGFATGKISAFGVFDHSRGSSQVTAGFPARTWSIRNLDLPHGD
jgi:hypothetical protein